MTDDSRLFSYKDGLIWAVALNAIHGVDSAAQIIIPIEGLEDLSHEEIGARACRLIPHAYTLLQDYRNALSQNDQALMEDGYQASAANAVRHPRPGFIYLVRSDTYYKIGKASSVPQRMYQFGLQLPFPFELLHSFPSPNMEAAERYLHTKFAAKRLNGEWFSLNDDDVRWICSLTQLESAEG